MNILAIDTAMGFTAMALIKDGHTAANHYERSGPSMSRSIITTLKDLMASAEMTPAQLTFVAVTRGPGSFTGTRIGIAVAKTFSQVLDIPLIGIDSLHLLAAQTEPIDNVEFLAALNCVRREIYYAPFTWHRGRLEPGGTIKLTSFQNFIAELKGRPAIVRAFESRHTLKPDDLSPIDPMPLCHGQPDGRLLARQARTLYESKPSGPFDPVKPLYIKSEVLRK